MKSFAVARTNGGGASFDLAMVEGLLGAARERLARVVVENLGYERCLELYDSPDTFFFVDPPYLNAKVDAYQGWTEDDLKRLRKVLWARQGQWVLTVDDSAFNRRLFGDCNLRAVESKNGLVNHRTHGKARFGELIITRQ